MAEAICPASPWAMIAEARALGSLIAPLLSVVRIVALAPVTAVAA